MKEKILLTKEKKEKLENELKNLEQVKKPELSSNLETARQNDLSEDTDDLSVMLVEKEAIEDRIAELKAILAKAKVFIKRVCNPNKVEIGSEITVECCGKKQAFTIVDQLEADPLQGHISDQSPLGKALMTAKVGSTVSIKVRGKKVEYKVLEIC
jgi:transcription elongation factor GreA